MVLSKIMKQLCLILASWILIFASLATLPATLAHAEEESNFFDSLEESADEFGEGLNEAGEKLGDTTEEAGESAENFADDAGAKTTEVSEEANRSFWQGLWDWFGKSFVTMLIVGLLFWGLVAALVVGGIILIIKKAAK